LQVPWIPALRFASAGMTISRLRRRCSFLRQRGLGLFDDGLECRRLANREIGQHLAVDRDAGLREPVDKSAVGDPEGTHRGVQALNPQRTEGALAPLAVAEGVLVGLLHRLLGDADGVLAPAVEAFGGLEDFLVLGVRRDAPFDASHGCLQLSAEFVATWVRRWEASISGFARRRS